MPKVLHRSAPVAGGTFIASLTGSNMLNAEFAFALAQSMKELTLKGHDLELEIYSENCHVDDGRNRLVRDFLLSGCRQLIFIDSDIRWEPKDLESLILHKKEVVAGIYPLKSETEGYPVRHLPGDIYSNQDGLIEVDGVPTGFLKINRTVLEKLDEVSEHYPSKDDVKGKRKIPLIFERTTRS